MGDAVSDLAVNLDRLYWRSDDNVLEEEVSTVLSAVAQWTSFKPSYVLAAMYQVEPQPEVRSNEQHASKATPQYGFHKGIKEFQDEGREATKQELYENLLGMDVVTMVKPKNLEPELCINALIYLMFYHR